MHWLMDTMGGLLHVLVCLGHLHYLGTWLLSTSPAYISCTRPGSAPQRLPGYIWKGPEELGTWFVVNIVPSKQRKAKCDHICQRMFVYDALKDTNVANRKNVRLMCN